MLSFRILFVAAGAAAVLALGCEVKTSTAPPAADAHETPPSSPAPPTSPSAKPDATTAKAPLPGTMPVKPDKPPEHVKVQHLLISFKGAKDVGKPVTRTKEEANKLAHDLLALARSGADFDTLIDKYTDDSPPGIYGMSNTGVTPKRGERPRSGMVGAFGDVGFAISPGNFEIAEYDPQTSPYGWHIIKRLE